jgi:hypothetical protein
MIRAGLISFEKSKNSQGTLKVKSAAVSKPTKLRGISRMASRKKATPFQKAHALDFALEVVSTDARGDVTVRCLFCLFEGRDVVEIGVAARVAPWACINGYMPLWRVPVLGVLLD